MYKVFINNKPFIFKRSDKKAWLAFAADYTLVRAAGGLVKNAQGELLFIFRKGKWDLPKGKLEKGETPETAALREVSEECGISGLSVKKLLEPTWHTYNTDKKILKKTWWFEMLYHGNEKPKAQTNEGITDVRWFDAKNLSIPFGNTYPSIRDLVMGFIRP